MAHAESCDFIVNVSLYVGGRVEMKPWCVIQFGNQNEGAEVIPAVSQPGSLHREHGSVTALTHKWVYPCNSNNCFGIFSSSHG